MVAIDNRDVTKALGQALRPVLRDAGFTEFARKRAWRYTKHTIDQISFLAIGDYSSYGVGCTTFSFSGEASVLYRAADNGQGDRPTGPSTFRGLLNKYLEQPIFHPGEEQDGSDRPDVWYVLPGGSNLDEVIADAARAAVQQGLPYLDRHNGPHRALGELRSRRPNWYPPRHGVLGEGLDTNPASANWLERHALLAGFAGLDHQDEADPATAPVLTPAERWLVRNRDEAPGQEEASVVASMESAGLEVQVHYIPMIDGLPHETERRPDLIHLYVWTDGHVQRASLF